MEIGYRVVGCGLFDSKVCFPSTGLTPDRRLNGFEIELFYEDQPGTAFIDNTPYKMKKGTVICGKPGQLRHSRLPFKCCYIHFRTDSAELSRAFMSIPDCFQTADFAGLLSLFLHTAAADYADDLSGRLKERSLTDRIIAEVLRLMPAAGTAPAVVTGHFDEMKRAKKYIDKNYAHDLSLPVIARAASLSPVYFHRLFCKYYGLTPAEYVRNVRITAAKELLLSTDLCIAEISERCGFSSQAYFGYRFKETVGEAPLSYRKNKLKRDKA